MELLRALTLLSFLKQRTGCTRKTPFCSTVLVSETNLEQTVCNGPLSGTIMNEVATKFCHAECTKMVSSYVRFPVLYCIPM